MERHLQHDGQPARRTVTAGPNPLAGGGGKSAGLRPSRGTRTRSAGVTGDAPRCAGHLNERGLHRGDQRVPELRRPGRADWYVLCGTSEAAPLFAGVVALADQVAGPPARADQPGPVPAGGPARFTGIVNVTSGSNSVARSPHERPHPGGPPATAPSPVTAWPRASAPLTPDISSQNWPASPRVKGIFPNGLGICPRQSVSGRRAGPANDKSRKLVVTALSVTMPTLITASDPARAFRTRHLRPAGQLQPGGYVSSFEAPYPRP